MNTRECQSDLVERARNATLSSRDRLALEAHLESCPSCRTARVILADFQEESGLLASDGARIERLAERALLHVARSGHPVPRRALRRAALLVAAALCLLASTAAARLWLARGHVQSLRAATGAVTATPSALDRREPTRAPTQPSAPVAPESPPAAAQAANDSTLTPARSAVLLSNSNPQSNPVRESASELLRRAADAKVAGNRGLAIELYKKLEAEFPSSQEAELSRVSLGRLLADSGYPAAALREYDLYLSGSHGGALIQEALYGKARTLGALGDRAEEARSWQRLLRDFPNGAYAPTARRRLLDLE
ncbi:MAG TPA: zf-HC2 domain-containing protein [Polyangiaceae bacterium]